MSLAIVITTNEGSILAADSMETYRNSIGDIREGSKNRMKLFQITPKVAAVACGLSFIENKNIHQHINFFKRSQDFKRVGIKEITSALYDYFYDLYSKYLQKSAVNKSNDLTNAGCTNIKVSFDLECINITYKDKDGKASEQKFFQPIMEFLVSGVDESGGISVYKITIPDPKDKNGIVLKSSENQTGAAWIGQTEVLSRIIRGWSPEIKKLKVIQELPEAKKIELIRQIDDQEYIINWGTMTFQDAIDFAKLAIKTTESIQQITDGTWQFPGSSPGVGGEIDIAVISREKGFVWVEKKKIRNENSENGVDLDL